MKTTEALDNDYIQSTFSIMLNARLAELTQQADPPYLYAGFGDDDYFWPKPRALIAFTWPSGTTPGSGRSTPGSAN